MNKVTIEEVAARAGVTKSTVSHALSGKRPVAAATRARIEAAIAALGYRPNPVAQRLASGRSRAIGLVFPVAHSAVTHFDLPYIAAATNAAHRAGYALTLVMLDARGPAEIGQDIGGGLLDGALLLRVGGEDPRVAALRGCDLPFVSIGRAADNVGLSYVDIDIDAALDLCVEHLRRLGHERIALLRDAETPGERAGRVMQAYELACARRRIRLLAAPSGIGQPSLQGAAVALLREHADVTGIVAGSERAGWLAREAAHALDRRVPGDLSIVALGQGAARDWLPLDLTRVDLQPERLATEAMVLLLNQLDDGASGEQQTLIQPQLTRGQTSAPA